MKTGLRVVRSAATAAAAGKYADQLLKMHLTGRSRERKIQPSFTRIVQMHFVFW
jgi:hypothetical protein